MCITEMAPCTIDACPIITTATGNHAVVKDTQVFSSVTTQSVSTGVSLCKQASNFQFINIIYIIKPKIPLCVCLRALYAMTRTWMIRNWERRLMRWQIPDKLLKFDVRSQNETSSPMVCQAINLTRYKAEILTHYKEREQSFIKQHTSEWGFK